MFMLNKLIRHIKGSNSYKLDENLTRLDLFIILKQRFFQVIRGFFAKIVIKGSAGFIFIGRNVKIRHANNFKSGSGLIVAANVYINALSVNGISLGDNVTIQRGSTIICTGVIRNLGEGINIGDNVGLNRLKQKLWHRSS